MKKSLLTLIILLFASQVWAYTRTHYVCEDSQAPAGAHDGSDWANCFDGFVDVTWDAADDNDGDVGPNDLLMLRDDDGIYREQLTIGSSGLSGKPITIGIESGDTPIISGADDFSGSVKDWVIYGAGAGSTWETVGITTVVKIVLYDYDNDSDLDVLTKGSDEDNLNDHEWFYVGGATDKLYVRDDTGDPDGTDYDMEAGQRQPVIDTNEKDYITIDGIDVYGGQRGALFADPGGNICVRENSNNITIQNLTTNKAHGYGIKIQGADTIIIDNITCNSIDSNDDGNSGDCIYVHEQEDTNTRCSNITVQNSTFDGTTDRTGVCFGDVHTGTISDNIFTLTSIYDASAVRAINFEPDGADWEVTNVTVSGNTFNITNGEGFASLAAIGPVSGITITQNSFDLNSQATEDCIKFGGVTGTNEISENSIIDGNEGITLYGATVGTTIKHNFFDGNTYSLYMSDTATAIVYSNIMAGPALNHVYVNTNNTLTLYNNVITEVHGEYGLYNNGGDVIVKNNIFYDNTWTDGSTSQQVKETATGSYTYDYNMYYPDGAFAFHYNGGDDNFADWQTNSSQDANSPTPADPLFTNAAGDDFRLDYNSPCEDAGTDLGSSYDDAFDPRDTTFPYDTVDQDLYGSDWEIGAFSYLGGLSGIVRDWDGNILSGGVKVYAYEISVAAEVATVLDQGYEGSATSNSTTGIWMIDNIAEDEYLVVFEYYGSYGGESKIAGGEFMDSIDIGVP